MKKICEITAETLPSVDEIINKAEDVCPVEWAAQVGRLAHQSVCGHGTFCRDGLYQMYLIPEDIMKGRGVPEDLDTLKECCDIIEFANECDLSVTTVKLVKASLENHHSDWYDHITRKRCKSLKCPGCYTLYIDPSLCNGCGQCVAKAPQGAVAGGEGMIHVIKKDILDMKNDEFIGCCPVGAIKKAGAVKPPVPVDPVPVGSFGAAAAGGGRRRRRG